MTPRWSVSCHEQTWPVQWLQKKKPPEGGSSISNLRIVVPVLSGIEQYSGRHFGAPKPWYAGL